MEPSVYSVGKEKMTLLWVSKLQTSFEKGIDSIHSKVCYIIKLHINTKYFVSIKDL